MNAPVITPGEGHTLTPWRIWDAFNEHGADEYPQARKGDLRLVGPDNICMGIIFGGYGPGLRELDGNAQFIVNAVNAHDTLTAELSRVTAERDALLTAINEARDAIHDLAATAANQPRLHDIVPSLYDLVDPLGRAASLATIAAQPDRPNQGMPLAVTEYERLRDSHGEVLAALKAILGAVKSVPAMQNRVFVGLGIQVNAAIANAEKLS